VIGAMVRYALLSVIRLSHEAVVLPLSILHDIVALVLPFVVEHTACIVQRWRNKPPGGICSVGTVAHRRVVSFALINGAFPTDNLPMIAPRSASRRFLMKISATIMWHVIVAHLFRIRAARAKSPVLPP